MNDLLSFSLPLRPASEAELAAMVADARAHQTPLAIEGGGTRNGLGRPMQTAKTLSLAKLSGITLHEPAEMIMSARAGTPISVIEAALKEKGQRLAFEPMDHRALLGSVGEPTIGAVGAINAAGPRRIVVGAARDSIVGFRFVNGRGEVIKNGGRVMKNVTGLDLVKLSCGAFGTLGVLTEVTFKVLPIPETTATLVFKGLDDDAATAAMTKAIGSPFEITGAAHLPAGLGRDFSRTFLRIEGFAESVAYRLGRISALLAEAGTPSELRGADGDKLWAGIRDASFLAGSNESAIWRISVKPTDGPKLVAALGSGFAQAHFYDWGGGLVWLAVEATGDAGTARLHAALNELGANGTGGHARLERAPAELRATLPVFQPQAEPLMRLSAGIKASFDPGGILNPGRMVAGV